MDDATMKLILDLANSSKNVEELTGKLKGLKAAGQDVAEAYEVLAASGRGYELVETEIDKAMDMATAAAVEQTRAMRALNEVLEETAGTGGGGGGAGGGKGVRNLGSAFVQTSYAVQDFASQIGTSGLAGALNAVQNNIPGILTGLGTGAGLAGVAGVAAVAVGLLYQNWNKLNALFEKDDLLKQAEAMKALAKATEEANAANEKIAAGVKGKAETDRGSDFRRALAEAGGGQAILDAAPDHLRATFADAIAKALQGSEQDIGFLRGGNRALADALDRPGREREAAAHQAAIDMQGRMWAGEDAKAQKDAQEQGRRGDRFFDEARRRIAKQTDAMISGEKQAAREDDALRREQQALGNETIRNNKQLVDLQSRGVGQIGQTQQQVAEVLERSAQIAARMDQIDAMLRKNETKLKSLRSGGRPR